jgi:hypothetical protein
LNFWYCIKVLKEGLRSWNNDRVGNVDEKIKALKLEVENLNSIKDSMDLYSDGLFRSNQVSNELRTLYQMHESL